MQALAHPVDDHPRAAARIIHGCADVLLPFADGGEGLEFGDVPWHDLLNLIAPACQHRLGLRIIQEIGLDYLGQPAQEFIPVFRHFQQRGNGPVRHGGGFMRFPAQIQIYHQIVAVGAAYVQIVHHKLPFTAGKAIIARVVCIRIADDHGIGCVG